MTEVAPHICPYLEYRDSSIHLVYPVDENRKIVDGEVIGQRWILSSSNEVRVTLQVVMFCPYCGEDFRKDLLWQIPGRPQENEILRTAHLAGLIAARKKPIAIEGKSKTVYNIQTDDLFKAVRLLSEQFKADEQVKSLGKLKAKCHNGLKVTLEWSNPGPKWNQPKPRPKVVSKKAAVVRQKRKGNSK